MTEGATTEPRRGVRQGEAARVVAIMFDGTKYEGTSVWQGLGDRIAYERRYATSILAAAAKLKDKVDEAGNPLEGFDWSLVNEERMTFFAWRVLRRAGQPVGEFEDWADTCEELELEALSGPVDGPAVPTTADPTEGPLPTS